MFGTNHFFEGTWLDSFAVVKQKLQKSEIVVGESDKRLEQYKSVEIDTTHHKGFKEILNKEEIEILNAFLLKNFNTTVEQAPTNDKMLILRLYQTILGNYINDKKKYNSNNNNQSIDFEIKDYAIASNKKFIGLDNLDSAKKIDKPTIFNDSVFAKAIVLLIKEMSSSNNNIENSVNQLSGSLEEWKDLKINYKLNRSIPKSMEAKFGEILTKRNEKWMEHLPNIIENNNSFIAVGIGHLQYKTGLITQLRKNGYTVKPVKIK